MTDAPPVDSSAVASALRVRRQVAEACPEPWPEAIKGMHHFSRRVKRAKAPGWAQDAMICDGCGEVLYDWGRFKIRSGDEIQYTETTDGPLPR